MSSSCARAMSPAFTASSTSSQMARIRGDQSWYPGMPAAARTSALTRSGCSMARPRSTAPPSEHPTTAARSISRASRTATASSRFEYGPSGRSERPNPRKSNRTARYPADSSESICASNMRESTRPECRRSTGWPSPRDSIHSRPPVATSTRPGSVSPPASSPLSPRTVPLTAASPPRPRRASGPASASPAGRPRRGARRRTARRRRASRPRSSRRPAPGAARRRSTWPPAAP